MVGEATGTPFEWREAAVIAALHTVKDPEMPAVSVVDLGMVEQVNVTREAVHVVLVPTFVGCPALEILKARAREALGAALDLPEHHIQVEYTTAVPWTSARIAPSCFAALKARGIAPPPADPNQVPDGTTAQVCPWCGSVAPQLVSLFGPTACRMLYYCPQCRNPFEAMKPV